MATKPDRRIHVFLSEPSSGYRVGFGRVVRWRWCNARTVQVPFKTCTTGTSVTFPLRHGEARYPLASRADPCGPVKILSISSITCCWWTMAVASCRCPVRPLPVTSAQNQFGIADEQGRPARSLGVRVVGNARSFWTIDGRGRGRVSRRVRPRILSIGASGRRSATWMGQGGAVFVHEASKEVISRLVKSAPLPDSVSHQKLQSSFRYSRLDSARSTEYADPLLQLIKL